MSSTIAERAGAWRAVFAVVALVLPVAGVGCSDDDGDPASSAAATTAPAQATKQDESTSTSDVLVRVGQTEITRARYDAVNLRLERNYGADRGYPGKRYFAPPRYRLCVKDRRLRRSVPPDASVEAVRKECRHIFWGGRRQLLGNLIEAEWTAREAAKQHVKAPPGFIARLNTLVPKLSARAVETADANVSDEEIAAYYDKYETTLQQPEQRRFREVVSATRTKAQRAKAALRAGRSWDAVVREYGERGMTPTEPLTMAQAGMEPALAEAVFGTRTGKLTGPLPVTSGFAVVEVERVIAPHLPALAKVSDSIKVVLSNYKRQRAASDAWRAMRIDARRRTVCLTDLKVPACSNGPNEGFDAYGGMDPPEFQPPTISG